MTAAIVPGLIHTQYLCTHVSLLLLRTKPSMCVFSFNFYFYVFFSCLCHLYLCYFYMTGPAIATSALTAEVICSGPTHFIVPLNLCEPTVHTTNKTELYRTEMRSELTRQKVQQNIIQI